MKYLISIRNNFICGVYTFIHMFIVVSSLLLVISNVGLSLTYYYEILNVPYFSFFVHTASYVYNT